MSSNVRVAGVGMVGLSRLSARQVDGARHALQHNIGIGSVCVVTIYETVDA